MAGGGFNPLKPPMPPGVNRLGLPNIGPQPFGGGGGGAHSRDIIPALNPNRPGRDGQWAAQGGYQNAMAAQGNPAGGPAPFYQAGPLQNALMNAAQGGGQSVGGGIGAGIAPGGSMAQFGAPHYPGIPQPAPQLPGGAIAQNWGLQPPGQTLGSQPMNGVGLGMRSFGTPGQVDDTYMNRPRAGRQGNM